MSGAGTPGGLVALVLAGGDLTAARLTAPLLEGVEVVVAADGGLRHAAALGLTPDLVVGDLDSLTQETLSAHPGVRVESYPRAKDQLDLELAIAAARERGATAVRVIGAFGDRLDQSLAALLIAARAAQGDPPFPVTLAGGTHEARVCVPGTPYEADLPAATTVSLLALSGGTVATAAGLRYPVEALELPVGVGLGVSNAAAGGRVKVRCESGVLAVVVEHGA